MPLIETTTTKEGECAWVKFLVHGPAGVGKTMLSATMPRPAIISAERGLLSLAEANQIRVFGKASVLPALVISSLPELMEAYKHVTTGGKYHKYIESVCLDTISEIAEVVLADLLKSNKDGRKAYGELNQEIAAVIRLFRDIPDKHVYFAAKQEKLPDENNRFFYSAAMPGKTLTRDLPYYFDEVFALSIGEVPSKVPGVEPAKYRFLRTRPDIKFQAKDRSGALDEIEQPNLAAIINKIRSK